MDPKQVKHVTRDNVTDEDIKPEGRTDGPKNFGPEFVTDVHGQVRPTRPAEHVERLARAVAEGARADGKDEGEVSRSFAAVLPPDQAAPISPSAQPVPSIVLGSMPAHEREKHEKKHRKHRHALKTDAEKIQYDLGWQLATDHKALPLEASEALEQGYEDGRDELKEGLQLRRERESEAAKKEKADREGSDE